jgi:hypothetical protein
MALPRIPPFRLNLGPKIAFAAGGVLLVLRKNKRGNLPSGTSVEGLPRGTGGRAL